MRNPLRKAGIFLGVALAGVGLTWLGAANHAAKGEHWGATLPIVLGVAMVMVGAGFLVQSLVYAIGCSRLRAGKGVIARWHLDAYDWDRFREFDRARAIESAQLVNDLWIRRQTPPQGVEVIVGKTSLLVDGSYHVLRPGGQPAIRGVRMLASPDGLQCLEFAIAYVNRYGVATNVLTLRVPFPERARHDAQAVLAHFQGVTRPRTALALRDGKRTIIICIVVAVLAAAAAATGFAMNADQQGGNLPVALGVGGTMLGSAALLLAALVAIIDARRRSLAVCDGTGSHY